MWAGATRVERFFFRRPRCTYQNMVVEECPHAASLYVCVKSALHTLPDTFRLLVGGVWIAQPDQQKIDKHEAAPTKQ